MTTLSEIDQSSCSDLLCIFTFRNSVGCCQNLHSILNSRSIRNSVSCCQSLHSILNSRSIRMDIQIICKSCELRGVSYTGPVETFHAHNERYHLADYVQCKFCPVLFSTLKERDHHIEVDHKLFLCVQCHRNNLENVFMAWDDFKHHYFVEHGDCKLKCDSCPNLFHLDSQRKEHMALWHFYVEVRPKIKCINCPESLPNKKAMLLHNKSKHARETFLCSNCHNGFREKDSKKDHAKNCKEKYD